MFMDTVNKMQNIKKILNLMTSGELNIIGPLTGSFFYYIICKDLQH